MSTEDIPAADSEDAKDLLALRAAKAEEAEAPTLGLGEVRAELDVSVTVVEVEFDSDICATLGQSPEEVAQEVRSGRRSFGMPWD